MVAGGKEEKRNKGVSETYPESFRQASLQRSRGKRRGVSRWGEYTLIRLK